jgi:hypothetical protein
MSELHMNTIVVSGICDNDPLDRPCPISNWHLSKTFIHIDRETKWHPVIQPAIFSTFTFAIKSKKAN